MWPWFQHYLGGHQSADATGAGTLGVVLVMLLSTVIVMVGLGLGWWFYGRQPLSRTGPDPLEKLQPALFALLRNKFYVDELYEASVVRFTGWCARLADWLDRVVLNALVLAMAYLVVGLSWLNRFLDEYVVNQGFDLGCKAVRFSARSLAFFQNGQVQRYLRVIGIALTVLALIFIWGCAR